MNRITTIIFLHLSCLFNAHSQGELAYSPSFTAIIVTDIEKSAQWYTRIFRLKEINRFESEERGFVIALLQNDDFTLELLQLQNSIQPQEFIPDYNAKTKVVGLFKIGFQVSEFDEWINHLKTNQVSLTGDIVTDPTLNKRMIIVTDPDENRIQFFER